MFDSESPTFSPEYRLIFSILNQAVSDVFGDLPGLASQEARDRVREEAINFCTATHGGWCRRRVELCTDAGIDPSVLRQHVVNLLDGDDNALNGYADHMPYLGVARRIWASRNDPYRPKPRPSEPEYKPRLEPVEIDDDALLDAIASMGPEPARPSTGSSVIHARHAERTRIVCDLINRGMTSIKEMADHHGVHDNTMRDWVTEAMRTGHVERVRVGVYAVVPKPLVAACR